MISMLELEIYLYYKSCFVCYMFYYQSALLMINHELLNASLEWTRTTSDWTFDGGGGGGNDGGSGGGSW